MRSPDYRSRIWRLTALRQMIVRGSRFRTPRTVLRSRVRQLSAGRSLLVHPCRWDRDDPERFHIKPLLEPAWKCSNWLASDGRPVRKLIGRLLQEHFLHRYRIDRVQEVERSEQGTCVRAIDAFETCHKSLSRLASRTRTCHEEVLHAYLCDWPDCPNEAVHALGVDQRAEGQQCSLRRAFH